MFRSRAKLLVLGAVILACSSLLAQDPDDVAQQQNLNAKAAAGKAQFQQMCGFCHGLDGRGASGPDLIRSALVSHDADGDLIGPVVRNGRPAKGMPAFQLSDTEIRDIAQFLHAEAKNASSVARRIPSDYPVDKLLVGNAEQGKIFFNVHCSRCHSRSGDLDHIAIKYKPFDLQTRIVFPSGAKPTMVVRDREGNTFHGEQVYADEFLVTLRDSHQWLHTWNRKQVQIETTDPLREHEVLLKTYSDANIHDLFAYLETFK